MGITVFWDNNTQTIIHFHYNDSEWQWHDFFAAHSYVKVLLDNVKYPVDVIIDITNGGLSPNQFVSQSKILYEFKQHPRVSQVIVMGADRFIQAFYNATTVGLPENQRFYFTSTLIETYKLLASLSVSIAAS